MGFPMHAGYMNKWIELCFPRETCFGMHWCDRPGMARARRSPVIMITYCSREGPLDESGFGEWLK